MSRLPQVGLVVAPPYEPGAPSGGAEAIADEVAQSLAQHFSVVVCHGYQGTPRDRQFSDQLRSISAFRLEGEIVCRGEIPLDQLRSEAIAALRRCAIVLQFERVVSHLAGRMRYAILGGVAYDHCVDCFSSRHWDHLIVPSRFVRDFAVQKCGADAARISVVPNGIDTVRFTPAARSRSTPRLRMLIAARPDPGKGYDEALAFKSACAQAGEEIEVACFRQQSPFEEQDFFSRFAPNSFQLTPWQTRENMPNHYRGADLTLCLGTTPEGFGLSAIESLACGTPVLAMPIGALPHLTPPGHGLYCASAETLSAISRNLRPFVAEQREAALQRGSPYVRNAYTKAIMLDSYERLVDKAIIMRAPR